MKPAYAGVSAARPESSTLSLATGPILLIRSQNTPVTSGVVECRLVALGSGNAKPSCRLVPLSDVLLSGVGLQSGCSFEHRRTREQSPNGPFGEACGRKLLELAGEKTENRTRRRGIVR